MQKTQIPGEFDMGLEQIFAACGASIAVDIFFHLKKLIIFVW
jgi:hypothetical protein